jgi:hypothetical protein
MTKKKFAQMRLISSRYFLVHNVYEGFVDANFYTIEMFHHTTAVKSHSFLCSSLALPIFAKTYHLW